MLQFPLSFVLTFCSFITTSIAKPTEIVEVIQTLPTIASPSWKIGDVQYVINDTTVIDSEYTAIVGNLAVVSYHSVHNQKFATEIIPLSIVANEVNDGPYIFVDDKKQLVSITVKNGIVDRLELQAANDTRAIATSIPSVPSIAIASTSTTPPADTYAMPPKLLAVSDIEGNLDHLIAFLHFHNVIDNNYNWAWGTNHLLFNGDSVDRGDKVTELLWFIRKLQQQAAEASGNVHFVLGNHEAMILADDIRYTHPKYKFIAERIGIPYHELWNNNSVLGNWLRAQNSIVQVGPYLFTHAGYGPELDALQLSKEEINSSIRNTLGPPAWPDRTELANTLAWHSKGPLWYRGYFNKHSDTYGPKPTDEELDAILTKHQAKAIIVGHTVTGTVGWLDGDKRLIGIDVHWDEAGQGQGLLIVDEKLSRSTMTESNLELQVVSTSKQE
jgi:hypothetical protein